MAGEDSRMPPKPTGNVYPRNGRWYARIRVDTSNRPHFPLETCTTREQAEARKVLLSDIAARLRAAGVSVETIEKLVRLAGERDGAGLADVLQTVDAFCTGAAREKPKPRTSSSPTFQAIGERWTKGELARDFPDHVKAKRSADDDRYRLERHVYPALEGVTIEGFGLDDAERVMRGLPAERSTATRRHVAQLLTRILSLAVFPLRLIKVSPIPRGFLPKPGAAKALPWLYPDEDRKLLGCTAVPLCWRVLYGFLDREGPRRSEAIGLTLADVDLVRGTVTLDVNKTDDPRAWALDPGTVRGLRAWVARRAHELGLDKLPPGAPLFVNEAGEAILDQHLADRFRAHLVVAKVDRPELHKSTAERRRVRIHDLRGTFVTVALANGKTEAWVQDRTGHKSSQILAKYRRAARMAAEIGLGELAPLDVAIPELGGEKGEPSPDGTGSSGDASGDTAPAIVGASAESAMDSQGCTRWDLNPQALRRRNLKADEGGAADPDPPPSRENEGGDKPRSAAVARTVARSDARSEVSSARRLEVARELAAGVVAALEAGDVARARAALSGLVALVRDAGDELAPRKRGGR
jgi:integrase